jgi:hypothetical protein
MGIKKHGLYGTPTYRTWSSMKQRCKSSKAPNYKYYGGKGISVCDSWEKFENFLADMGERPENMTIDRIDSNGDYTPENCRWADADQQNRNRSCANIIEFKGVAKNLTEWAKEIGMNKQTLAERINSGWSIEKAITQRKRQKCR